MHEYIERRAAEKAIRDIAVQASDRNSRVYAKAENVIHFVPAADVEPVRHGEWVKTSEFMPIYGCSMCGKRNLFRDGNNVLSTYCPNCGAKMDGGQT